MVSLLELKSLSSFLFHKNDVQDRSKNKVINEADCINEPDHGANNRPQCGGYNEAFILERWAHFEHPER